jgi:hypothetical protein
MSDMSVMMTAWRRPAYLRRTLESWAAVDGLRDLRQFVVALDPSDRQDAVRSEIKRSALAPELWENSAQLGCGGNPAASAQRMFQEDPALEFLIFAEDDLLVSDDVLRYFAWAKEEFRDRSDVLLACAHSNDNPSADADPSAVTLACRFRCWVWATWRDRWDDVLYPTWDWDYTSGDQGGPTGWDHHINLRIMPPRGLLAALPAASRSQNIGRFEGVHADPAGFGTTQNPSFREHREPVTFQLSR